MPATVRLYAPSLVLLAAAAGAFAQTWPVRPVATHEATVRDQSAEEYECFPFVILLASYDAEFVVKYLHCN